SRPPQGHPLIVQAGSSEDGKNFATAQADAHFAIYSTKEDGIKYRQDINERLARHGRRPESFKILPGILPVVAASEAEGREKQEYLQTLLPDQVGIDLLSSWSGPVAVPAGRAIAAAAGREHVQRRTHVAQPGQAMGEAESQPARDRPQTRQQRFGADRRRHAGTDRRPVAGLVRFRCRRRLQRHALLFPRRTRCLCDARRAGTAATRPVPQGVRG
ncbi:MAG: LLM class flavin-dependent oxidoreductase, partial [Mesorhizobium sp.]